VKSGYFSIEQNKARADRWEAPYTNQAMTRRRRRMTMT
jgi:hypothetical protein